MNRSSLHPFPLCVLCASARGMVFVIFALIALVMTAGPAHAQSLRDPSVEGVLFYQAHPYADSPLAAWPIEYHSAAGNDKIVIVITKQGTRLRLTGDQVAATVPYPGRAGLTQEQGLQLCDAALARFPRSTRLLTNVRQAWVKMTPQDLATHATASATRQSQMDATIQRIADQAAFIQRQTAIPFISLWDKLKPTPPPAIADAAAAAINPQESPEGDPTADYTKKAGGPMEVEKNLDVIKDSYKRAQNLENLQP